MALGSTNSPGIAGKDAVDAKRLASAANENASTAMTTAEEAKTAAEAAQTAAGSAQTAAAAAQTAAENAQTAATKAAEDMEKISQAIEEGGIGGGSSGGNTIKITFESAFAGQTYTVTDGDDTKTGTVPDGLVASVQVANCNSTYTIKATADNGLEYSTTVATGAYYGQYSAVLAVFNATIYVTAVAGANVTAMCGDSTYTATAGSDGIAAVEVSQMGIYTVSAAYDGVSSGSASVEVREDEHSYTAAVRFVVLKVKAPAGSLLTIRKKEA